MAKARLIPIILYNLALLCDIQEKYKQAEPLYQQSLPTSESVLEPQHADILTALENYTSLLQLMFRL